jgi:asparagine synthase (glutamine-hydrolysing)
VPEFDETSAARETAARLGTEHQEFRVEPNCVEVLDKLVWHYDEPFGDSSAIPTYYVSKLTRQHVTVALTGDGGDELFAGYLRYKAVRLAALFERLPGWMKAAAGSRLLSNLAAGRRQRSLVRRAARFGEALRFSPQRRYFDWMSMFNEMRRAELYSDAFLAELPDVDPFEFLAQAFARVRGRDPVTQASLVDLQTYLPCDLLTKVDIASMANSLECRAPFLDHRVVELAARMPIDCKLKGRRSKRILQQAFPELLPSRVMRRPKMGFGVPLERWFRHELADYARQVLLDPRALARGYFRPEVVRRMLDDHQSGTFDHSYRLWGLLFFELWQKRWLDDQPACPAVGALHQV